MILLFLASISSVFANNEYGDEIVLPVLRDFVPKSAFKSPECPNNSRMASLFVDRDVQVDHSMGTRGKARESCEPCSEGSQYSYAGINPQFDISDVKKGFTHNLIVGGFSCTNERDLCVESVEGKMYRPTREGVSVYPVPFCKNSSCSVLAVLDPGASLRDISGNHVYSGCEQISDLRRGTLHRSNAFPYLQIKSIACNACRAAIRPCHIPLNRRAASTRKITGDTKFTKAKVVRRHQASPEPQKHKATETETFDSHGAVIPDLASLPDGPLPDTNQEEQETKIIPFDYSQHLNLPSPPAPPPEIFRRAQGVSQRKFYRNLNTHPWALMPYKTYTGFYS